MSGIGHLLDAALRKEQLNKSCSATIENAGSEYASALLAAPRLGAARRRPMRSSGAINTTLAATQRHPCRPGMVAADCAWFRSRPESVVAPGGTERSAENGGVDLIRCGLRAHEAGRRDADPQTEPMMMMMMMSASLGRGGGGQAQRATGSSPTAPRFNNCRLRSRLNVELSLPIFRLALAVFIPWRGPDGFDRRAGWHPR
jgi:hypothetical protein